MLFKKIIRIFIWLLYYTFYIIPIDLYKNFLEFLGLSVKEEYDGIEKIGKKIAIFVLYPGSGKVTDNNKRYISNLKDLGFSVILISNAYISSEYIGELKSICSKIIIKVNHGRDFGSYKYGIMKYKEQIMNSEQLLLVNDSTIPIKKLDDMFAEMGAKNLDMWGISESYKKMYEGYHICSYFLSMSKNLIKSSAFWDFWKKYKVTDSRVLTINRGEIKFTYEMKKSSFKTESYIDSYKISKFLISNSNEKGELNPIWFNAILIENLIFSYNLVSISKILYSINQNGIFLKIMLKLGMPILKKDIFLKCKYYIDDIRTLLESDASILYCNETISELVEGINKKRNLADKLLVIISEK